MTPAEHRKKHRQHERGQREPGEENPTVRCACGCASTFPRFDSYGRRRRFVSGHNQHASPTKDAVLRAICMLGDAPRSSIVRAAKVGMRALASCLCKLKMEGSVVSVRRGVWRAV
jgi:hypothetical protein